MGELLMRSSQLLPTNKKNAYYFKMMTYLPLTAITHKFNYD